MRYLQTVVVVFLMIFLVSCGGSSSSDSDSGACSVEAQNNYLYELMNDRYFWYTEIPNINPENYPSPDALLNDLIYSSIDKWSYIEDKTVVDNYYNGANVGLGVGFWSTGSEIIIRYVYPGSPADIAGFTRGTRIISMNGYSAAEMIANSNIFYKALGSSTAGYNVNIEYRPLGGSVETVSIVKQEYFANPVLHSSIHTDIDTGDKTGYIVFKSFNNASESELDKVFNNFKQEGVSSIIFDLRDNGGGLISVVRYIGYMFNNLLENELAGYLDFNAKHKSDNYRFYFGGNNYANSFSLNNIVFLTTKSSASSSELLINSLKPYINVYLIGDDTYGKPVGMRSHEFCDKYFVPIEFRTVNSVGTSDYYSGLTANCYVGNTLNNIFGDANEPLLDAALNYIKNDNCSGSTTRQLVRNDKPISQIKYKGVNKIFQSF